MEIKVKSPDLKDVSMWQVKMVMDGIRDRKGMEELADDEIGPDVRYVLQTNDIALVKRYLRAPITTAEYRELRYKLINLLGQQVAGQKLGQMEGSDENKKVETAFSLVPEVSDTEKIKERTPEDKTLIDLVA
ncbi:MAG: hypothetical protein WCQ99_15325 [Pseudomonadota bacterium]